MSDIEVVLLDGIGLFFFIIPGVIAYAVDFNNGTIYLPHGKASSIENLDIKNMTAINVGKESLTNEKIKTIVAKSVGHNVDNSQAQVYKVDNNGKKVALSI